VGRRACRRVVVGGFGVDGHYGVWLIGDCEDGGGKPECGVVRACAAALQEGDPFVGCGKGELGGREEELVVWLITEVVRKGKYPGFEVRITNCI
jgi:hypothetical protein